MALVVKNLPDRAGDQDTQVQSLGQEDPLEKEMPTHSSTQARAEDRTEEPGKLQSVRYQRF